MKNEEHGEDLVKEEIDVVAGGTDDPVDPTAPIGVWDRWPPWIIEPPYPM